MVPRIGVLVVSLLVPAGAFEACTGGLTDSNLSEGTRCNPYSSHNDCGDGLTCQTVYLPAISYGSTQGYFSCGESYCCPTPASSSSNANCTGVDDAPQPIGPPPSSTPGALQCPLYCSPPGMAAAPPSLTGPFLPVMGPWIAPGGAATVLDDGGLSVSCPGDGEGGAPDISGDAGGEASTSDAASE